MVSRKCVKRLFCEEFSQNNRLFFGIASVAGITVICYLMGLIVKNLPLNNKWIPSLAGLLGGILGLVGWRFMPDFPAGDVLTALAVGIVSGLAATGVHEAGCQLTREKP